MISQIRISDNTPLFYGNATDNQIFIGWTVFDAEHNPMGTITKIEYAPDDIYKSTDGYAGCAYKAYISTTATTDKAIPFRHIKNILEKMGAHSLERVSE